jgi:diacylglycerol kinase (ATP)
MTNKKGWSKPFAVVNPLSANGRTGRKWPRIHKAIEQEIGTTDFRMTTRANEGMELVREALAAGYDYIISAGGDGFNNECINGFFEPVSPGEPDKPIFEKKALYATIARGTGCDFIKTIGFPKPWKEAAKHLASDGEILCDVGRIDFFDQDDKPATRYFINIADCGIGGDVVDKVNNTTKMFGGFVSFLVGAIRAGVAYKNKECTWILDDGEPVTDRVININVCNGQYYGGGMWVAPMAKPDDGYFEVIIQGNQSKLEYFAKSSSIYKGGHIGQDKIYHHRAKKIEVQTEERMLLDVDGEQPGRCPATFTLIPAILRVKC